jgi:hypothetical protein
MPPRPPALARGTNKRQAAPAIHWRYYALNPLRAGKAAPRTSAPHPRTHDVSSLNWTEAISSGETRDARPPSFWPTRQAQRLAGGKALGELEANPQLNRNLQPGQHQETTRSLGRRRLSIAPTKVAGQTTTAALPHGSSFRTTRRLTGALVASSACHSPQLSPGTIRRG